MVSWFPQPAFSTEYVSHACQPPQDNRDSRPMAYAGRLVSPLTSQVKEAEWFWRESSLFRLRRTMGEPKQIHSRDMVTMESVDETALPGQPVTNTHGAQKYAQLGGDCCSQIISSAMESCLVSSLNHLSNKSF